LHNSIPALALLASLLLLASNSAVAQQSITLDAVSDQGTFTIEITWNPDDIGSANAFGLRFVEPETGEEIEDVKYDFSIYNGNERELLRRDQTTTRQEFTFDKPGSYTIMIGNIEGLGEHAQIPIQVTPEFPSGVVATVAAAVIAAMLAAKLNSNNLFRQAFK
jgi:hypothetical protein